MIALDLSKQRTLDADPKAVEKMRFTEIQSKHEIQQCCKRNLFGFYTRNCKSIRSIKRFFISNKQNKKLI